MVLNAFERPFVFLDFPLKKEKRSYAHFTVGVNAEKNNKKLNLPLYGPNLAPTPKKIYIKKICINLGG